MRNISIALLAAMTAISCASAPPRQKLQFDHIWLFVQAGAPERAAFEKAGFVVDPQVSRHDGQGTASVSVEFDDGYIELMWLDTSVNVVPEAQRAVEKFRQRTAWRTSGWSPFGINLSPTTPGDIPTLPFPTWDINMPWMDGSFIRILTARDDTASPSVSIHPKATHQPADPHPNGTKRISHVRIVAPPGYKPVPAMLYAQQIGAIELGTGNEWLAEITLDGGRKRVTRDLRPDLPLVIKY